MTSLTPETTLSPIKTLPVRVNSCLLLTTAVSPSWESVQFKSNLQEKSFGFGPSTTFQAWTYLSWPFAFTAVKPRAALSLQITPDASSHSQPSSWRLAMKFLSPSQWNLVLRCQSRTLLTVTINNQPVIPDENWLIVVALPILKLPSSVAASAVSFNNTNPCYH